MSEDVPPPSKRRAGLGRGLSALLGEMQVEAPVGSAAGPLGAIPNILPTILPQGLQMVDVGALRPMPNQPRKNFDEDALDELAASIKARGLLQPIVVRETSGEGLYQIVAGERRWRAAQRAQLHQVPVIIREFDDQTALELAIIENIQREQLNAWEEGNGFARLVEEHGYSHETLAKIVGKSRSHVANLIRLQNLPVSVHNWLAVGDLSMGHARALLTSADPEGLARQVIAKGLSVRQTEALVRKASTPSQVRPRAGSAPGGGDADIAALERQLSGLLGLKVVFNHRGKSGQVSIAYSSLEQLDMICQRLSGEAI
jgi:ParB family transcriptional regulator, chromosome partitioning protein